MNSLSQKVDAKIIFTDYWKVLVSNFSVMGNTIFLWVKKLMERWYLLFTEKFLFWTFRWWKIRSFSQPKSWWKDDIYLVFLSFPWYSRTWEIWLFVQWIITYIYSKLRALGMICPPTQNVVLKVLNIEFSGKLLYR